MENKSDTRRWNEDELSYKQLIQRVSKVWVWNSKELAYAQWRQLGKFPRNYGTHCFWNWYDKTYALTLTTMMKKIFFHPIRYVSFRLEKLKTFLL